MKKRRIGLFILIISILILVLNPLITGKVISESSFSSPLLYFLGLFLLFLSFKIISYKKSLDAIIIPTGPNIETARGRAKRAAEEYDKKGSEVLIISGFVIPGKYKLKGTQQQEIYKILRKHGIKPSQMRVEGKSKDTIENILYSSEILKKLGARDIGIASEPSHLSRFERIIEAAKKEGYIDEDFKFHRLETEESMASGIYGILANVLTDYKLRKGIDNARKSGNPRWVESLKSFLGKFYR